MMLDRIGAQDGKSLPFVKQSRGVLPGQIYLVHEPGALGS